MVAFHHDKNIDTLVLSFTLPNMGKTCSHRSNDSKVYPFTEREGEFLEKIDKKVVGGPSIVYTRKKVVDKILIRKSTN